MAGDARVTHAVTHNRPVRHHGKPQSSAPLGAMVTHGDALYPKDQWKGAVGGEDIGARRGPGNHNAECPSPSVTTWAGTHRQPPFLTGDALPRGASPDAGPVELAEVVARIVERAQRLRAPSARDPEAFHLDKSELVGALVALERRVREGGP